jgi:HK97 family phage portal protein
LALKERDARGIPVRQYVLDWDRITPLVAPDGSVFYEARQDDLSHIPQTKIAIPASEVIHDRFNCLFHPLIGVSPLFSSALAAKQGLEIQGNSAKFFANMSQPGGILTAPSKISDENAARLKNEWEKNFAKGQLGKIAVLGDGLKYEAMAVKPVDAELVDQLKLSAEQVCSAFGVPKYMIGVGDIPSAENAQVLTQWYYDRCLQKLIEAFERLQDEGLGLKPNEMRTEFDLDDLLRMDSKSLAETEGVKVQRGISAPNESRLKFNLRGVAGGDQPYLQQQNFSLEALAKRDSQADPFKSNAPASAPTPTADEVAEKAAAVLVPTISKLSDAIAAAHDAQQRQQQEADERERARAETVTELQRGLDAMLAMQQEQRRQIEAEQARIAEVERQRQEDAARHQAALDAAQRAAAEAKSQSEALRLLARIRTQLDARA